MGHNRGMEVVSVKQMIDLLNKKNSYLVDFQKINNEELTRMHQDNFSNLEAFYYSRELILNAMDKIDQTLGKCKLDQLDDVCELSKQQVLELLKKKKQFIHLIVDQDMKIHEILNASVSSLGKAKIA